MLGLEKTISTGLVKKSDHKGRMKRHDNSDEVLFPVLFPDKGRNSQIVITPGEKEENLTGLLGNVYNAAKIPLSNLKTLVEIFTDEPELFTKDSLLNLFRNIKPSVLDLYNLLDTLAFRMDYIGKHPDYQQVKTNLSKFFTDIKGILSDVAYEKGIEIRIDNLDRKYMMLDRNFVEKISISLLQTLIRLSEKSNGIEIAFKFSKSDKPKFIFSFKPGIKIHSSWFENQDASSISPDNNDESSIMLILELKLLKEIMIQCKGDLLIRCEDQKSCHVEVQLP